MIKFLNKESCKGLSPKLQYSHENIVIVLFRFCVIAPYPASHESELTLRIGDIIFVTQKRLDGWYKGKSTRTGTIGIFPSIFVEPYQ